MRHDEAGESFPGSRFPLEAGENAEQRPVRGEHVSGQQSEGEAAGKGQYRDLDVVREDLEGESCSRWDCDTYDSALSRVSRCVKPRGEDPDAETGSNTAQKKPRTVNPAKSATDNVRQRPPSLTRIQKRVEKKDEKRSCLLGFP